MSSSTTENTTQKSISQTLEEFTTLKPVSKSILLNREEYQFKWLKHFGARKN